MRTSTRYLLCVISVLSVVISGLTPYAVATEQPTEKMETLVWSRAPFRMALPVNTERRTDFPVEVDVFVPDAVADKVQVTATPEGSVFWKANAAFKTERMLVADKSGRIQWLMDISAEAKAPQHPLMIRDSRVGSTGSSVQSQVEQSQGQSGSQLGVTETLLDEVDLVRVAARQFYGPSRLAELPPGVSNASFSGGPLALYHGAELDVVVKGAWRAASYEGELFVTAVQVTNKSRSEVRPDPRRVRGNLLAMAAQHSWLAPAGQFPHDTTLWYLVTDRPLQEVTAP